MKSANTVILHVMRWNKILFAYPLVWQLHWICLGDTLINSLEQSTRPQKSCTSPNRRNTEVLVTVNKRWSQLPLGSFIVPGTAWAECASLGQSRIALITGTTGSGHRAGCRGRKTWANIIVRDSGIFQLACCEWCDIHSLLCLLLQHL